jgi:alkaline phosphatase
LGTLHEAAKRQGLIAGLVATSRITHATPAAFSSHVDSRADEGDIALQQVTKKLDFAFGGGARYYLASQRSDGKDLVANLTSQGYTVVLNRSSFDSWATKATTAGVDAFPVFGLLADDHMEYEIDRSHGISNQPSLTQIVTPLLAQLGSVAASAGQPGFMVMIEGSRVDHAGHTNDPATHMREALEFDATVALALQFREKYPNTLVISVADHETGGLGLGRDNQYFWYPDVLNRVNASTDLLATYLVNDGPSIAATIFNYTGVTLTQVEIDELRGIVNGTSTSTLSLSSTIGHIVSLRAGVSWTTLGHTGMDIGLYAQGPDDWTPAGVHENTDINQVLLNPSTLLAPWLFAYPKWSCYNR